MAKAQYSWVRAPKPFFFTAFLSWAVVLSAQQAANQLVPVPETTAVGASVLRANLANAKVGPSVGSEGSGIAAESAENAISQDAVQRVDLPTGNSTLQISLANVYSINRISFRSFTAQGSISVHGSAQPLAADDPNWVELVPPGDFGQASTFQNDFPDTSAQFVQIRFNITVPGSISPFAITGEEFMSNSSAAPPTAEDMDNLSEEEKSSLVPYDFASVLNGSRVQLVSSGNAIDAVSMIDDDVTTAYEFDSSDRSVTVLIDLTASYRVNRVAVNVEAPPGRFAIYTFNILPSALQSVDEEGNPLPVVELPDTFFDSLFPLGTRDFEDPIEAVEINFDDTDARFAVVRWTPPPNLPDGVEFPPIKVYEISLIGLVPDTLAAFPVVPAVFFAPPPDLFPGAGGNQIGPTPDQIEAEIPPEPGETPPPS